MSSSLHHFLLIIAFVLIFSSFSHAQTSSPPNALIVPVMKHAATPQILYITTIDHGTPLEPKKYIVDLGGRHLWIECDRDYKSSTYRPGRCGSSQCSVAKGNGCHDCAGHCPGNCTSSPGCNKNICITFPENTITQKVEMEEIADDVISLQSTDGTKSGPIVTIPRFIFACGGDSLLQGLPKNIKGMAGLGKTRIALPTQLAAVFSGSLRRKFALCLSSSTSSNGVIFFGDAPYVFYPDYNTSKPIDISKRFTYTPLITNPKSTAGIYSPGEPSVEYFIGVKSIRVNRKQVPLNSTLLSINAKGVGGTKISTINPYTIMETSIYKGVTEAFIKEMSQITNLNISRVAPVAPFGVCFSMENIPSTGLGLGVPEIELVLQSEKVIWVIHGANSMVQVNHKLSCLGFVDGGLNPPTSIIIGGHQLEDNLLQFDLAASRIGFSSTLLLEAATCANFKLSLLPSVLAH